MSLVASDIDALYEATELSTGGAKLPDGIYTGTVNSIKVEPSPDYMTWCDYLVKGSVKNDQGMSFFEFELSPLRGKDGEPSLGKIKFVKWQLEALGYKGRIGEVEFHLGNLIGNEVEFEVKSTVSAKLNPKTNQPYINKETLIKNFIGGNLVEPSETQSAGETPVY